MQVEIAGIGRREKWGMLAPSNPAIDRRVSKEKPINNSLYKDDFDGLLGAIAKTKDRQAFKALFQHFGPRVKTYLMGMKLNEREAEDLVQEVFITVWRKAGLYDPEKAKASTWIFTIARNRMIDEKRKQKRFPADELRHQTEIETTRSGETALAEKQTRQTVQGALKNLPEDQRSILELAFLKGLTHAEIAEETGLALGTVKSRIRLAFEKMRHQLEHQK